MMQINDIRTSYKLVLYSNTITMIVYIVVCLVTIYSFGYHLGDNSMNIIVEQGKWETYTISIVFVVISALNAPLFFFIGKEALLIIIFTLMHSFKQSPDDDVTVMNYENS